MGTNKLINNVLYIPPLIPNIAKLDTLLHVIKYRTRLFGHIRIQESQLCVFNLQKFVLVDAYSTHILMYTYFVIVDDVLQETN